MIRLVCRESNSLTIEIGEFDVAQTTVEIANQTQNNPTYLFMLKVQTDDDLSSHRIVYIVSFEFMRFS